MINNVRIAVKDSNKARINAAIHAAEGRARVRLLDYDAIVDALEVVEGRLSISKCAMTGTTVSIDCNAQSFPACYKGVPESTW